MSASAIMATSEDCSVVAIPSGMTEVTREEFWRNVMSEKLDVMPSPERLQTHWMVNGTTRRWGWSSCGFVPQRDGSEERFALARVGGAS